MNVKQPIIAKKHLSIVLYTTLVILMLPLVAMQFTTEVNWTVLDFVVAGCLLTGFGCLFAVFNTNAKRLLTKVLAGVLVFVALLAVWSTLI